MTDSNRASPDEYEELLHPATGAPPFDASLPQHKKKSDDPGGLIG